jgi:hypothetical protein
VLSVKKSTAAGRVALLNAEPDRAVTSAAPAPAITRLGCSADAAGADERLGPPAPEEGPLRGVCREELVAGVAAGGAATVVDGAGDSFALVPRATSLPLLARVEVAVLLLVLLLVAVVLVAASGAGQPAGRGHAPHHTGRVAFSSPKAMPQKTWSTLPQGQR